MPAKPTGRPDHLKFIEALRAGRVKSVSFDPVALCAALGKEMADFFQCTGMCPPDPNTKAPIYCNTEYHFRRMAGAGAEIAYYLYTISCRVAHESKTFSCSLRELKPYLNVKNDHVVYDGAALLVRSGWWEPLEVADGSPTKYRPRTHEEWANKFKSTCIEKREAFPFQDNDEVSQLGRRLYAVFGGLSLYPSWTKSLMNTGATADQIVEAARDFMRVDSANGPKMRFKRFHEYLEATTGDTP